MAIITTSKQFLEIIARILAQHGNMWWLPDVLQIDAKSYCAAKLWLWSNQGRNASFIVGLKLFVHDQEDFEFSIEFLSCISAGHPPAPFFLLEAWGISTSHVWSWQINPWAFFLTHPSVVLSQGTTLLHDTTRQLTFAASFRASILFIYPWIRCSWLQLLFVQFNDPLVFQFTLSTPKPLHSSSRRMGSLDGPSSFQLIAGLAPNQGSRTRCQSGDQASSIAQTVGYYLCYYHPWWWRWFKVWFAGPQLRPTAPPYLSGPCHLDEGVDLHRSPLCKSGSRRAFAKYLSPVDICSLLPPETPFPSRFAPPPGIQLPGFA